MDNQQTNVSQEPSTSESVTESPNEIASRLLRPGSDRFSIQIKTVTAQLTEMTAKFRDLEMESNQQSEKLRQLNLKSFETKRKNQKLRLDLTFLKNKILATLGEVSCDSDCDSEDEE